ncbi:hypothetical protein [Achromobacter sp.]
MALCQFIHLFLHHAHGDRRKHDAPRIEPSHGSAV